MPNASARVDLLLTILFLKSSWTAVKKRLFISSLDKICLSIFIFSEFIFVEYRNSVSLCREINNTAVKDTKKSRDRRMLNPKSERT